MLVKFPAGEEYRKVPRRFDLGLRVPAEGDFRRIRKDTELEEFKFLPRQLSFPNPADRVKAYPATRRFKGVQFIEMPDAWCKFWVEEMIPWAADGCITDQEARQIWTDLIREHVAMTDGHSPQAGYHDPISGQNPGAPNIAFGNIGFIGNIVKVGKYGVECLDMSKDPPTLGWLLERPWLYNWMTEQTASGVISNFPNIEEVVGVPCGVPVPLVSIGGWQAMKDPNYYERVKNGSIYNVYSS